MIQEDSSFPYYFAILSVVVFFSDFYLLQCYLFPSVIVYRFPVFVWAVLLSKNFSAKAQNAVKSITEAARAESC